MKSAGVLCALDVNDYDPEVVDLAATLARQYAVGLDLIHVTWMPESNAGASVTGAGQTQASDHELLQRVTTSVEDVDIRRHHLSGSPPEEILKYVERHPPQLLVMGTHGRRGLARVLGSTASYVLRRARCPVMVARQRQSDSEPET